MIKRFFVFLIKVTYLLPFFLFGLWLLHLVYFPHAEDINFIIAMTATEHPEQKKTESVLLPSDDEDTGPFHITDELFSQPEPYLPLCLTCHGTYPHSKEAKVRSILNFHTGFMACSICHVRRNPDDKNYFFAWVERHTGDIFMTVEGEYGKYPAEIFPIKVTDEGNKEVYRPVSEKAAQEYLRLKDQYTPDQIAQVKIKLHEHISKKPIFCTDCHKKNGYLNFAELGFPQNRVSHLISTEVAGMIEKYETFYLPSIIDFSEDKTFK